MKHNDVKIGNEYATQCGGRVSVIVLGPTVKRGFKRDTKAFLVKNSTTGRTLVRTAAALHELNPFAQRGEALLALVKAIRTAVDVARSSGKFDRAVALREISAAVCSERRNGARLQHVVGSFQREHGALPKDIFSSIDRLPR